MPRQPVPAPPPAARPINLRTSARLVDDGLRWENGISLLPEECSPGFSVDPCHGPQDVEEGKAVETQPVASEWDPYIIGSSASCAYTINEGAYGELAARARRSLEAQTSHLVENILWTNVVDGIDWGIDHPNTPLIDTATVGTPAPPVTALEQMDELLIAALGGRRGMIHAPAPLMHHFAFYGLLEKNGNVWETKSGNIVVPGTGYPGTDTAGAADPGNLWIYGTSPVELRLSEIQVVPGDLAGAIDRETNQIVVRAERYALAYWDLCAHVGVPVCLTDPGPACGSES